MEGKLYYDEKAGTAFGIRIAMENFRTMEESTVGKDSRCC